MYEAGVAIADVVDATGWTAVCLLLPDPVLFMRRILLGAEERFSQKNITVLGHFSVPWRRDIPQREKFRAVAKVETDCRGKN